jgi:hypothetical protein
LIWTFLDGSRLGDRIGEGVSVQQAFTTPGFKTVELRLSELCVGTTRLTCDSAAFVTVNVEGVPPAVDTTAPTITASGLEVEATGPDTVVDYTFDATDPDDAVAGQSCSPAPGEAFPVGETPIDCTAVDSNGNVGTASFAVIVHDTTAPELTAPAGASAEATSAAGAVVNYDVFATDLVDGAVAVSCSTPSGSTFALGLTSVACSATDAHGNTGHASFDVLVGDSTAPELTAPAGASAEATSAAGAIVNYDVSATDLVDGAVVVSCSTPSGSTFPLGSTNVTCSATDAHGNTGHAAFAVTVNDSTAPSLTLPGTITTAATSPEGAVVAYDATASDIVDGAITPDCSPASGATFAVGSTTVDCTAADAHGNSASGSFVVNVVVVGDTPPTLVVPSTIVVNATSPDGATVTYVVTAADSGGGALTPDCSPASGATFAIGTTTVTCTAADSQGNTSSAQFTVRVKGAAEQLLDFQQTVNALQAGGLRSMVRSLIRAVAAGDTAKACNLIDQLSESLGKKLTADQRAQLRGELARISDVLGCATTP